MRYLFLSSLFFFMAMVTSGQKRMFSFQDSITEQWNVTVEPFWIDLQNFGFKGDALPWLDSIVSITKSSNWFFEFDFDLPEGVDESVCSNMRGKSLRNALMDWIVNSGGDSDLFPQGRWTYGSNQAEKDEPAYRPEVPYTLSRMPVRLQIKVLKKSLGSGTKWEYVPLCRTFGTLVNCNDIRGKELHFPGFDTYIIVPEDLLRDTFLLRTNMVVFNFDRPDVISGQSRIKAVVEFLRKHPEYRCEVWCHTDIRGSDKFNLKLSEHRAKAIVALMKERYGLSAESIFPKGGGENFPLISEDEIKRLMSKSAQEEAYALNRRTEFYFIKEK